MFILFGEKTIITELGMTNISGTCSNCHNQIHLKIIKHAAWFTLYFIPVFPFSVKRYKMCPICQISAEISKEEAENLLKQ
ncbi:MAG: zinc ribbon domain-containing protein [Treponemataceae bacterium]|nr:zinc ribbon domain-containing protein [Treponemataceae bacterium]